MFNWFSRSVPSKPPHLTQPDHYERVYQEAGGEKQRLTLIGADTDGLIIELTYRWTADLSDVDADKLDTRARAYVACAIYDAAMTAGLDCEPGPPHGQRPAWLFRGEHIPVSLMNAGFDVTNKICCMHVGPGMMLMGAALRPATYARKLVAGFRAQFREINV